MIRHMRTWKQEQQRRRFVEALRRSLEQVRYSGHFLIEAGGVQ